MIYLRLNKRINIEVIDLKIKNKWLDNKKEIFSTTINKLNSVWRKTTNNKSSIHSNGKTINLFQLVPTIPIIILIKIIILSIIWLVLHIFTQTLLMKVPSIMRKILHKIIRKKSHMNILKISPISLINLILKNNPNSQVNLNPIPNP